MGLFLKKESSLLKDLSPICSRILCTFIFLLEKPSKRRFGSKKVRGGGPPPSKVPVASSPKGFRWSESRILTTFSQSFCRFGVRKGLGATNLELERKVGGIKFNILQIISISTNRQTGGHRQRHSARNHGSRVTVGWHVEIHQELLQCTNFASKQWCCSWLILLVEGMIYLEVRFQSLEVV